MEKTMRVTTCALMIALALAATASAQRLALHYTQPAEDWQSQALPIGNGRLGAMIFGDARREHVQLNEISLWTGDENDTGSYQNLGDLEPGAPHRQRTAGRDDLRRRAARARAAQRNLAVDRRRERHGELSEPGRPVARPDAWRARDLRTAARYRHGDPQHRVPGGWHRLPARVSGVGAATDPGVALHRRQTGGLQIGRASCRERV